MLDIISCERNLISQIHLLEKLIVQNKVTNAFDGSTRSVPFQKRSQETFQCPRVLRQADPVPESKPMTLVNLCNVFKDHTADPVPERKPMTLPHSSKVVDDQYANPVPESKAMTMSDTNKRQSVKAGIGSSFFGAKQ